MIEEIFKFTGTSIRPIVSLGNYTAMFDTGAEIPLCRSESVLKVFNYREVLLKDEIKIGTVGGEFNGRCFQVDNFSIGKFIYPKAIFVVPAVDDDKNIKSDFLIPASMIARLSISIDFTNGTVLLRAEDDQITQRCILIIDNEQLVFENCI